MKFDYMGILLDKAALANRDFTIQFILPDVGEQHALQVKNGVVLVYENAVREDADAAATCPKNALLYLMQGNVDAFTQVSRIEGDAAVLELLAANLTELSDSTVTLFNIVEP